jgi:hypothetical protein
VHGNNSLVEKKSGKANNIQTAEVDGLRGCNSIDRSGVMPLGMLLYIITGVKYVIYEIIA